MPIGGLTLGDFIALYEDEEMGKRAFYGRNILSQPGLMKVDDPLLTSTTGAYQAIIAADLWNHVNVQPTIYGALPKPGYPLDFGWRVITGAPTNKVLWAADAGAIGETQKMAFQQITNVPSLGYVTVDAGIIQQYASKREEQAVAWQKLIDSMGEFFVKGISTQLLADVDTVITDEIESVDRIVASKDEEANCLDANDADIYTTIDRSTVTWADGTVLHNSDADRDFDIALVNTCKRLTDQTCGVFDVGTRFWLTRHDTWQRWGEWLQSQQQFIEAEFKTDSVNGMQTAAGADGGFALGKYMGHAILPDADVVGGTIGHIYYLNTKHLQLGVAVPTKYVELGGNDNTLLALGKFATEGMFYMVGDPLCTGFHTMGKVRDLK